MKGCYRYCSGGATVIVRPEKQTVDGGVLLWVADDRCRAFFAVASQKMIFSPPLQKTTIIQ